MTPFITALSEILKPFHRHNCHSQQAWFKGQKEPFPCDCDILDTTQAIVQLVEQEKLDFEIQVLLDTADGFESELLPEFEKGGRAAINALRAMAEHRKGERDAMLAAIISGNPPREQDA